jgi:DNA transformation protein and related proteins
LAPVTSYPVTNDLGAAASWRQVPVMPAPVSSIRNLGPAMEAVFARIGIGSAEELRALGADAAYGRLLESGYRPHFIAYYVLVMGLQGRPWNDARGDEKAQLRARFDALKSAHRPKEGLAGLEAVLDEIGVVPHKPVKGPGKGGGRHARD